MYIISLLYEASGRALELRGANVLVKQIRVPMFLADGLNAKNVREAVAQVQPFGLDICSGIRNNSRIDHEKLEAFVQAARA